MIALGASVDDAEQPHRDRRDMPPGRQRHAQGHARQHIQMRQIVPGIGPR